MTETNLTEEERKRFRELETGMAALRERTHSQNGKQQSDLAVVTMLAKMDARIEAVAAANAAAKPSNDLPVWGKWIVASGTFLGFVLLVFGGFIAYGRSGAELVARVQAIETWKTENVSVPSRLQTLETNADTARRIRDQQQQGMNDRLVGLERSDVADRDRLNTVLQTLATITAQLQAQGSRVEELLRRQDRLENRLGTRGGSAVPQEQPTSFPAATTLLYRMPGTFR